MFIGRVAEMKYLQSYYEQVGNQLLVIYGQKEIGKTTLLKEFCKGKPFYYYRSRICSTLEQKSLWQRELNGETKEGQNKSSFGDIFQDILRTIDLQMETTKKAVIIIDEFQDIVKTSQTFMNELVMFLKELGDQNRVLIILASSSIGFIENSMVTKIGASAYSISSLFKIRELNFQSITTMFPNYNMKQCLEIYSVLGGIPGYLNKVDDTKSVSSNLEQLIIEKGSPLELEAVHIVADELRETGVYHTILGGIASGNNKLNELYLYTGFSRAKISVYLKNLMEHEIVEKVFSYDSDGREHAKKGIYRICNHIVHFWFRFMYPNLSTLEFMPGKEFYQNYMKSEFSTYVAGYYRTVCMEYLLKQISIKENKEIHKSGEWVGKVGGIDIILEDELGEVTTCFCKYEPPITTYEDYEWNLFCLERAMIYPAYIYLFSATGFDTRLSKEAVRNPNIKLVDLAQL